MNIDKNIEDLICQKAREGQTIRSISEELNLDRTKIERVIDFNKIPRRKAKPKITLTESQTKKIISFYANGYTIKQIGEELNINSRTAIVRILIGNGIEIRKKGGSLKGKFKYSDTDIKEMCRLYTEEKLTSLEIAKRYNTNGARIIKYLKINNVELRLSQAQLHKKLAGEGKLSKYLSCKAQGISEEEWTDFVNIKTNRIRSSQEYKDWKISVFKRDNYKCRNCGIGRKGCLQVHHIYKIAKYPALIFDTQNGITLCFKCHSRVGSKEDEYIDYFKILIQSNLILNENNIQKIFPAFTPIPNYVETEDLKKDYNNGMKISDIAKKHNMSPPGVKRRLQKNGIKFKCPIKDI